MCCMSRIEELIFEEGSHILENPIDAVGDLRRQVSPTILIICVCLM
jgi:hypothetical protein